MKKGNRSGRGMIVFFTVVMLAVQGNAATTAKTTTAKTTTAKTTTSKTTASKTTASKTTTAKKTTSKKKTVKKTKWVTKGAFTYYTINGKVQKQFVTIGKKTYYFSKNKGVQRTGWRHIGKYYYYFRNVAGKGGYMLTSCTVDGIRINKKGHAVLKTAEALRKTDLMQKYQRWADRFITPGMSDEQKIYACLNQLRRFRYRNESDSFQVGSGNWDVVCAQELIGRKDDFMPTAECYRIACGFCYLVNAAGLKDVRICAMPGHGWSIVNGTIYDATRVINRGSMEWFPVSAGHLGEYTAYFVRALN